MRKGQASQVVKPDVPGCVRYHHELVVAQLFVLHGLEESLLTSMLQALRRDFSRNIIHTHRPRRCSGRFSQQIVNLKAYVPLRLSSTNLTGLESTRGCL